MTGKSKAKRGRPPKQKKDLHTRRIVFMADDAAHTWLGWRCAETGASVSEVMRRALAAYMIANPSPDSSDEEAGL
jgi:hypothetical protein